jgi:hypothetical protein
MTVTLPKSKRRGWRWLVAAVVAAALSGALWMFAASRTEHAATERWVKEAHSRSLDVLQGTLPKFSVPWEYRIVNSIFNQPVVILFGHRKEDFDNLAKMRPCPVRIVVGFRFAAKGAEIEQLDAQLAKALKEQEASHNQATPE